jgi:hypothetical protein
MPGTLLFIVLVVALTIVLTRLIFGWGSALLAGQVEARMRAAEQITRQRAIPDDWLRPFRARAAACRADAGNTEQLRRVAGQAQRHCLRKIDDLLRFYEHSALVDSAETRRVLLSALQEQRTRWERLDWTGILTAEGGTAV